MASAATKVKQTAAAIGFSDKHLFQYRWKGKLPEQGVQKKENGSWVDSSWDEVEAMRNSRTKVLYANPY